MKLPRRVTVKINRLLDQWLPPVFRDASWFLPTVFNILFKEKARCLVSFKDTGAGLSDSAFLEAYAEVDPALYGLVERPTDLHEACIPEILASLTGQTVLEVGCGKGYLASLMAAHHHVTACDMVVAPSLATAYPQIRFLTASVEKLPFEDAAFDTVVCTHTLEHVQDLFTAIRELRRVAKKRLIVVVPKQRPYKYTFDLHLHFFPYPHSLLNIMGRKDRRNRCQEVGGDLLYVEEISPV